MDISYHDLLQFAIDLTENPVKHRASHFYLAWFLLAALSMMAAIARPAVAQATPARQAAGISITVRGPGGEPIPGATVRVENDSSIAAEAITDREGKCSIPVPVAGQYVIAVMKEGLERSAQVLLIEDSRRAIDIEFAMVKKLARSDSIDVIADPEAAETKAAVPGAQVVPAADVDSLPIHAATVTDTLPLVPGVVSDSNGVVRISGQTEDRSALVVNAVNVNDPNSGNFGATVPVGSVESIDVLKTPFLPEYGQFTSAVVSVQTKRGSEQWHYALKEPFPDFRVRSGHIRGLRDATPKFSLGGPVIGSTLYWWQSADYSLEKKQVRTLSFPTNESKVESVNSFSQLDYVQSPQHFITGTIHVMPRHINFYDPQFFNPQQVTPSFRGFQRAWSVIDHSSTQAWLIESTFTRQIFTSRVGSQGDAEMVLMPTGNLGNYFANQHRGSSRLEWMETLSRDIRHWGLRQLKFGSLIARTATSGDFAFRPVDIRDSDGTPIQRIEYTAGSPFEHSDVEHSLFAQGHWAGTPSLSADGGLRVEHQTKTSTWRMAPRLGIAWTPPNAAGIVVRSGFGVFYDRVPLAVYAFSQYPEQIVTSYDASGQVTGKPRHFFNVIGTQLGRRFRMLRSQEKTGNFAPYSETWTVEVEKAFSRLLHLRAGYQHSNAGGGILVVPRTLGPAGQLVLEGNGRSRYQQFEMTARVSWKEGQQMFFSFVHSRSRGDLNVFNSYVGDFPVLPVRPNVYSNLPGDMPNRFISWGFVNAPWKLRIAPIVEYRTGAPYAVLDATRNYVGIPYDDKTRLRNHFSADVRISKEVRLVSKYKARISVVGLNLTNHFNSLDVHANTADPLFGTLFGHYKRRYRADFELLF